MRDLRHVSEFYTPHVVYSINMKLCATRAWVLSMLQDDTYHFSSVSLGL